MLNLIFLCSLSSLSPASSLPRGLRGPGGPAVGAGAVGAAPSAPGAARWTAEWARVDENMTRQLLNVQQMVRRSSMGTDRAAALDINSYNSSLVQPESMGFQLLRKLNDFVTSITSEASRCIKTN